MKKLTNPTILPTFTLLCGILGLALRIWLFFDGMDQRGLLSVSHPAHILTFILTAFVLAVIFVLVRPLNAVDRYLQLFPSAGFPAIGCVIAAAGIVWVNFRDMHQRLDNITVISLILGLLAVISLLILAVYRFKRLRPPCYYHAIITVYLMLHLISQYRLWSGEPQLQIYFFPLLSSVFLMLTAYHSAVLDSRKNGRRWFILCNQAALYCCCLSLWGDNWPFYLTMGVWMVSGICTLDTQIPENTAEEG